MLRFLNIGIFAFFAYLSVHWQAHASPASVSPFSDSLALERRTDPVFPASPASCPICQQSYPSIQSCCQAAPVLANFTMIIFNPGAFIDVIKCACADTFQSVFPQCVDCFIQTGQQDVLSTANLPSLVGDIKNICALESTLLGNVSEVDSAPKPTTTSGASATRLAPATLSFIGFSLFIEWVAL